MSVGRTPREDVERALADDCATLARAERDLAQLEQGGEVENLTIDGARSVIAGVRATIGAKRALLSTSY